MGRLVSLPESKRSRNPFIKSSKEGREQIGEEGDDSEV